MARKQDNISLMCWAGDDVGEEWTHSAWRDKGELKDLQSCNHTIEAFVGFGPRCVSITVHLLITPSNPKGLAVHSRLFIS